MKHTITALLAFVLSGCANVGTLQTSCQKTTSTFPSLVRCVDDAIAQDSRMARNPRVELYRLKAAQLSRRVEQKQIDELDARVELQQIYVKLRSDENAELNDDIRSLPTQSKSKTECYTYGSSTSCTTK